MCHNSLGDGAAGRQGFVTQESDDASHVFDAGQQNTNVTYGLC
jgi:hypothetical protein